MGGKGSGRRGGVPYAQNPLMQSKNPDVDPDVNKRVIARGVEIMEFPELDFSDAEAIRKRFYDYLALCDKYALRPMVSSAASAFGLNRDVYRGLVVGDVRFRNWRHGILTDEGREVLRKSYQFFNDLWETYLLEDRGNPVKYIFLGKNYFGMRDQTEQVQVKVEEKPALPDYEEIAARYAAMVGQPAPELGKAEIVTVEDE